ncbi:Heat shock 70 kDa protein BIP2 [Linum perenne]
MIGGDVIGIDLGTTYSCVAVSIGGNIEIIPNDQGNRITPSFVAFSDYNSELLVGEAAKNQAILNPTRTIFDIKRLIGKNFDDPKLQRDLNYLPYTVVNRDWKPCVQLQLKSTPGEEIQIRVFTPEEISAMVLGKMKETAESYLGNPIAGAVITVPAYFNDAQGRANKEADKIAGLNVLRIINEPTAGAIAYGLSRKSHRKGKRKILVYDLGGGTFERELHGNRGWSIRDGMDFIESLSRAKFEELDMDLFEKTLDVVKKTMEDGNVEKMEIEEIVLIGGSSRIPKLREMLKDMFDGKDLNKCVSLDEAVAYGAALLGAKLGGNASSSSIPVAKAELSFEIDEDGILTVTAKEKNCSKDESKSLTISSYKRNINAKDVASILQEAKQLVDQDNKEKERIVAGLALEQFIYDYKAKVNSWSEGDKKTTIVNALEEAFRWYDANVNASKEDYEYMKLKLSKVQTHGFVELAIPSLKAFGGG